MYKKKPQGSGKRYNSALESLLDNRELSPADIKHVVNEKSFIGAIDEARRELGLTEYFPSDGDENEIEDWLAQQLAKSDHNLTFEEWHSYIVRVTKSALKVIDKSKIQSGWYEFIVAFIALGKSPKTLKPLQAPLIEVENITEDGDSIVIRLEKGLSSEDYKKAWKLFKRFLGKPRNTIPYAEQTKTKIFIDKQSGLSYTKLAQKYYPSEYQRDLDNKTDYATSKVKKIVSRFKLSEK